MKILVTGGSGFIGRAVCALAVERGLTVTSLSRHGPSLPTHTPVLAKVSWLRGSVFDEQGLDAALQGVEAVVHCVGIGRERPSKDESFKRVNGDSAIVVGEAAKRAGVRAFVFLSAGEKPPWAHEEYLSSKRRAEVAIAKICERLVVLRPGLVYGPEKRLATFAAGLLRAVATVRTPGPRLEANTPVSAATVARAVMRAVLDPNARGVVEPARIAGFAEVALAVTSL
ncbi:MAG: NAD-dependent epimerase/dehydratase family protein [Myxococcota bacterium]